MPPRENSRHMSASGVIDRNGKKYLTEVDRVRFESLPDNQFHTVGERENLFGLAGKYFFPLSRAAGLWWIIADFQTPPIVDPTLTLTPGTVIVIPSLNTVLTKILREQL